MMKFALLCLILMLGTGTSDAQQTIAPIPGEDILMASTDHWMVWNRVRHVEDGHAARGGVISTSFYLQRFGERNARLVYRDTVGMIQPFVPVWVKDDGTIIGWDGFFQTLKDGKIETLNFISLPGSSYYPVLCGVMRKGVLMLTQNDQQTTDAYERVYFVPWSKDRTIVHASKAVLISDSTGIPFFWPSVRWCDDVVVAWRPPVIFRYDLNRSAPDSFHLVLGETSGGPSQLMAFDGKSVLLEHAGKRWIFSLSTSDARTVELPPSFSVLSIHGSYVYGVLGAALTKSDTLTYLLQAYDFVNDHWQTLLRLGSRDIVQEAGWPLVLERNDGLMIWSGGRWHEKAWLK